ncbi:MAG: MarR family transcriptional regulator [Chloroflexaceae bacterium]|nr:MarR family transcriptional regulator [Chloroflexaceae bacterium]NJO06136.1 MarR family transcriptional regulator [Chloroflexaceae bacterium]
MSVMTTTVHIDPQASEPSLEAYVLLRQINSMLDTCNRYDLRGENLTVPQFAILNHATPEGVPLSEISARMFCDNSNLTGIVDRLISKGYVERRPDPQDRRVSLICLTQAGADKLRNIRPRHHESVSRRMHVLSKEKVQQLRDLLQVLHEGLGSELGLASESTAPEVQPEPRPVEQKQPTTITDIPTELLQTTAMHGGVRKNGNENAHVNGNRTNGHH